MKYKSALIRGVPLSKAKNPCLNSFLTHPQLEMLCLCSRGKCIRIMSDTESTSIFYYYYSSTVGTIPCGCPQNAW